MSFSEKVFIWIDKNFEDFSVATSVRLRYQNFRLFDAFLIYIFENVHHFQSRVTELLWFMIFFTNGAALSLVNCHCFFVSSELRAWLKNLLDRFYRSTSLSFKLFKINKSCFHDVLNWLQFQVVLLIQHKHTGLSSKVHILLKTKSFHQ